MLLEDSEVLPASEGRSTVVCSLRSLSEKWDADGLGAKGAPVPAVLVATGDDPGEALAFPQSILQSVQPKVHTGHKLPGKHRSGAKALGIPPAAQAGFPHEIEVKENDLAYHQVSQPITQHGLRHIPLRGSISSCQCSGCH